MAEVEVTINGRAHTLACEDGQERHLTGLASKLDSHARGLAKQLGAVPESRLMLMTALMAADELADMEARLAAAKAEVEELRAAPTPSTTPSPSPAPVQNGTSPDGQPSLFNSDAETRLAKLLVGAADRLEAIADRLDGA